MASGPAGRKAGGSARAAPAHGEESLDVRVGAGLAVAVEVRAGAGRAAGAPDACEEGLDVGVCGVVAVAVEVGGPAGGAAGDDAQEDAGACVAELQTASAAERGV